MLRVEMSNVLSLQSYLSMIIELDVISRVCFVSQTNKSNKQHTLDHIDFIFWCYSAKNQSDNILLFLLV